MEKWLKSNGRKPSRGIYPIRSSKAYYGKPVQLFKDSDRDGVMNVFDCQPHNRRKQDVISPSNFGGGVQDMYYKQEQTRQQRVYLAQIKELQRLEEARVKELERIQGEQNTVVYPVRTYYETYNIPDKSGNFVSVTSAAGKAARGGTDIITPTIKQPTYTAVTAVTSKLSLPQKFVMPVSKPVTIKPAQQSTISKIVNFIKGKK